jgi:hypothetical protein
MSRRPLPHEDNLSAHLYTLFHRTQCHPKQMKKLAAHQPKPGSKDTVGFEDPLNLSVAPTAKLILLLPTLTVVPLIF